MVKELFKSILIHTICFQLLYLGVFQELSQGHNRTPASFDHQYSLEELTKLVDEFKTSIKGKELEPDCGEAATAEEELDEEEAWLQALLGGESKIYSREDRAFFNYVDSLKGNSCGAVANPTIPQTQDEECKSEKVKGYIDTVVEEVMKREKDDLEPKLFRLDDPKIREFHQRATFLMQEVRKYLADTSVERQKRISLLVDYLGGVALPVRDLIVVMRGYIPHEYDGEYFYESLLPEITSELVGDDDLTKDIITSGPNKMVENFHLQIIEKRWGRLELKYNPSEVLARDIVQILKAPTAKNYVRALKWMTLQMMMTQALTYDAMLGETKPLEIPRSCQNHFNGNIPDKLEMQFTAGEGDVFLDRILADHGLIMSEGDTQYSEYYLDNVNKDPTLEGYSGLMPFENYKAAFLGLDGVDDNFVKPTMDDYTAFEEIAGLVRSKASSVFHDRNSYIFGLIDFEDDNYFGASLMDKIMTQPETSEIYQFTSDDGEEIEIPHVRQNLSTYLVELMQRHKVEFWEDLISERMESSLKRRFVKIRFPSLHGATVWRMWALSELENFANKYERAADMPIKVRTALMRGLRGKGHWISEATDAEGFLQNLRRYLHELKVADDFVPTRRLTTGDHIKGYQALGSLWDSLSGHTDELELSRTNEYEYLKSQMNNGNPWARVRLGYLLLEEELRAISQGSLPEYSKASMAEFNGETINSCKKRDVTTITQKIRLAGSKMGINKILTPNYATSLLDKDEKQMIWSGIIEKASPLFKQKNSNGTEFYSLMENVSYQTFLSQEDIQKFVSQHIHEGLRDSAWEEIEQFFETDQGKAGSFYNELYKLKGNTEDQLEYFEAYSQDNGIDNQYKAKLGFLMMDNALKRSVLKSLLRGSANLRKNEIMGRLESFCNLEPSDHEKFKTLFYATSNAQNQLNQLTGAPTVPQEVLEGIHGKMNEMSDEEWTDMWLGLGAGVLGVTAMLIGGACTGITGGLCAPLGVAMVAAGASAMTMQVSLVSREYNRKVESDQNAEYVKEMERLGFASHNSSDNVKRWGGWFWTIFEAVSIIPLIGVTARAMRVGTKLTVVSTGMMARNVGKHGFKTAWKMTGQAGRTVVSEADVRFARLVLGFDSLANQSKEALQAFKSLGAATKEGVESLLSAGLDKKIVSRAFRRIRNLRQLHASGKLSAYSLAKRIGQITESLKRMALAAKTKGMTYTSRVVVNEAPQAIDEATAKVVSEYFAGNPKGLEYLMSTYAKRIPKAIKNMERYEKGTSLIGKATLLPWIRNGIRSLRSAQIAKYGDEISRIHKELGELALRSGNLEEYILKNVDSLTDIFVKIPVRKREIPYMFFVQGGPHLGKSLSSIGGKTAARLGLYRASNGLVMRKFFNARSRLIYESMKAQARNVLGLKTFVASETALESFKAFQEAVAHATDDLGEEAKKQLLRQYDELESKLAKKVLDQVTENSETLPQWGKLKQALYKAQSRFPDDLAELNEQTIKRLLFSASTEQEKAVGTALWASLPPEDLFDLREVGEVAHRVIRELSDYENVDEFQAFLNALKVLVIKRDPGVVEIM